MLPRHEPLLAAHHRDDLDAWTFGPGGQVVTLLSYAAGRARIEARGERIELELSYGEPHNSLNTLAAVAAARALGVAVDGPVDVRFSTLRGEVVELPGDVVVVNDCYNANPMSMRRPSITWPPARRGAASRCWAHGGARRRVARPPSADRPPRRRARNRRAGAGRRRRDPYTERFPGEIRTVDTPEEAANAPGQLAQPGDRVLIKGSRSAGLERVLARPGLRPTAPAAP